ncbi:MAG: hypothetical protein NWE81_01285 [Candidatus Bathyarchaeota archaeon]|nr:hypothetical protein [Candidatus Bathyarchaeota archaeon]
MSLQEVAATGCPRCQSLKVEFRHDRKHKIVRFHCVACRHETSYEVRLPKPGSFEIVPVMFNGVQIGEKIVDHYHPATKRQRYDAIIVNRSRGVENGRISLGGEWYSSKFSGSLPSQKRFYFSFEEAALMCNWHRTQLEHEKRLRELEGEVVV